VTALDLAIIVLYFAVTLGLGLRLSRRQRTATDYFLGAGNLPAWSVLLSVVATETSALTVISIPGIAARGDLTFLQIALGYVVGRVGVAIWLLPGYFEGGGQQLTAYARLEDRFGVTTRRAISTVFLSTRFLADGVRIFAGAIPLALVTGWSIPTAIVVMGVATLIYTLIGGLKAVVWADVIQLTIYTLGGLVALFIAWRLAGGPAQALELAREAGKLRVFDFQVNLTTTYTFLGGLVGGALLSAASHGTDQLIVQRLLATGSLPKARTALVGSGVLVLLQFLLFLMVGSAIWAAGLAPDGRPSDQIFAQFIVDHLPSGVAGLLVAGILAAAMSTLSSSINAMASSATLDLYATRRPEASPEALLRVGRWFSAAWAMALIGGALAFYATATRDTPVVVLALSIASITYGGLLGTYILAGKWPRALGRDVLAGVTVSVFTMLLVVFASRLAPDTNSWLAFVGRLAWPWYVPLGTALTVVGGVVASYVPRKGGS